MSPISDKIMGAVLAGGLSSRFGSDKAVALLDGRRLIDRAIDALSCHCDIVVIIGRDDGVADWPRAGMGPLGGLAGAMRHASASGYDMVLSCGVDSVGLPYDLLDRLSPGPSCLLSQPIVGLWPVSALPSLEAILTAPGKHSVMRFADAITARRIELSSPPANVNTLEDLERLRNESKYPVQKE